MCGEADNGADEARSAEKERQGRVASGRARIDQVFDQYGQPFYQQRAQKYEDFARPQLQDQYSDALKNLTFALSRSGRLNSSTGARRKAKAQEAFNLQEQQVSAKGQDFANELEQSMNAGREQLHTQNLAAANPELAASLASSRARAEQQVPAFSPLVDAFKHFSEGLATQQDWERRQKLRNTMEQYFGKDSSTVIKGP